MTQMELFAGEQKEFWFLWDPPFTFTEKTLALYARIIQEPEYEIAEMEKTETGDILCKLLISPVGLNRISNWVSERSNEQLHRS